MLVECMDIHIMSTGQLPMYQENAAVPLLARTVRQAVDLHG